MAFIVDFGVPDGWTNFFILVGTGSATLAGLVLVAMTINLKDAVNDATHRYRAINMLSGFTSVFILSALALMGQQTFRTLGTEWLIVAVLAAAINTSGYIQGYRMHSGRFALGPFRIIGGSACYLGQIVGSVMLLLGVPAGLYVSAIALIVNFYFFVSGAWLLVIGAARDSEEARP